MDAFIFKMYRMRCPFIEYEFNFFAYWKILYVFCLLLILFSEIPSEFQTVWIQSRPNVLSGLTWVQTCFQSYRQTATEGYDEQAPILKSIGFWVSLATPTTCSYLRLFTRDRGVAYHVAIQ